MFSTSAPRFAERSVHRISRFSKARRKARATAFAPQPQVHPPESFSRVQFFERNEPDVGCDVDAQKNASLVSAPVFAAVRCRSEEHTSELQSRFDLVCRLLLEKKKTRTCARTLFTFRHKSTHSA